MNVKSTNRFLNLCTQRRLRKCIKEGGATFVLYIYISIMYIYYICKEYLELQSALIILFNTPDLNV